MGARCAGKHLSVLHHQRFCGRGRPGPPMRATASPSLLSPVDPPTSEVLQAHTRGNQGVQLSVLLSECVFTDSNEVTKERKFFACPECSRYQGPREARRGTGGQRRACGPRGPVRACAPASRGRMRSAGGVHGLVKHPHKTAYLHTPEAWAHRSHLNAVFLLTTSAPIRLSPAESCAEWSFAQIRGAADRNTN